MKPFLVCLFLAISLSLSGAAPRTIEVFVALCDNETQGIVPVGKKIGDGNKPADNLYWGCDDGLWRYFNKSAKWKLLKTEKDVSKEVMVRLKYKHVDADLVLTASAYRGSAIKSCTKAFEASLAKGDAALVAYIGHNGLMDFSLVSPAAGSEKKPAAVVLCCKSESYFKDRITRLGGRPILLTDQFMYPGSFLLHDAIEEWRKGKSLEAIRVAAGRAYARNQKKISVKAATGVFAKLDPK